MNQVHDDGNSHFVRCIDQVLQVIGCAKSTGSCEEIADMLKNVAYQRGIGKDISMGTRLLAKKYGGTFEGHRNSVKLYSIMQNELNDLKKKEFFFKSYYYCIGKKK